MSCDEPRGLNGCREWVNVIEGVLCLRSAAGSAIGDSYKSVEVELLRSTISFGTAPLLVQGFLLVAPAGLVDLGL